MGFFNRLLGKETFVDNNSVAPSPNIIVTQEDEFEIAACISAVADLLMNTANVRKIIIRCQGKDAMPWSFAGRQEIMYSKTFLGKH